jgi:hypothetical protein
VVFLELDEELGRYFNLIVEFLTRILIEMYGLPQLLPKLNHSININSQGLNLKGNTLLALVQLLKMDDGLGDLQV